MNNNKRWPRSFYEEDNTSQPAGFAAVPKRAFIKDNDIRIIEP